MARRPQRESISKVDTAWLRMEQPTNLMMITGVIVLDEGLDYERLLRTVEQRFLAFKRFRQRAVDGPAGAYWELDEDFDLRAHVRRVALPEPADRRELEILVSDLASMPLDHSRPLWQFHLVENYEDGPAMIVRIHHCIADGIALVQVFLSLTDDRPDAPPAPDDPQRWTRERSREAPVFRRLMEPAREGLDFVLHLGQKALEEGARVVQDPARAGHYAAEAGDMMGELAHALALPNDPPTPLKGPLGPRKLAAWTD
ncbi:MAG: wax ester/triacylglycerol synthase family O-acyltransferase, partial [Gammaproteobacteria bacterium]